MPNVENSLALMLNEVNQGRISLETVVHAMCDAPARVWDIVRQGSDSGWLRRRSGVG